MSPKLGKRIFRRFTLDEDVDRELQAHLELCIEELVEGGWDPDEARGEAVRRFGNRAKVARKCRTISKRRARAVRRGNRVDNLKQDLRYALRTLIKSPGFTLVAVLTLALGIGANATVFSLVNGVLLRPLPYPNADQLVYVSERTQSGGTNWVAWPNYEDWREESRSFQGIAAFNQQATTILGGAEPAFGHVAQISRDFWTVFPVAPIAGRLTVPDDHREGAAPVAVVMASFAEEALGGQEAVGKGIEIFGTWVEVVGVIPDAMEYPSGVEIWVPAELTAQGSSRTSHNWRVVGRLHPGMTPEDATLELDPLTVRIVASTLAEDGPEWLATGAVAVPLQDRIVQGSGRPLVLLMGAAAFVLLVACTNLASTILARGTARARELAVRSAVGATQGRIVRQLLSEAALLAGIGGGLGILLAQGALTAVRTTSAGSIPRLHEVTLDGAVLLFTVAVTVATALAFGLFPALKAKDADQAVTLRSEGRGSSGYRGKVWGTLVAAEVALALVLLSGSGLLIRSFTAVLSEDAGFEAEDVVASGLALSRAKYPEIEDHRRFWDGMLEQAAAIPGVGTAGLITSLPMSGVMPYGLVALNGDPSVTGNGSYIVVSPEAFDALDIPLLQGRLFDEADGPDATQVAVVSRSFAELYWPGEDPIGKQVSGGGMDDFWDADPAVFGTVVGVVADVRYRDLTRVGRPAVYWNYRQRPFRLRWGANLVTESATGDPALIAGSLRRTILTADPDVAPRVRLLTELVSNSVAVRRFTLLVMTGFAGIGLLLAALGIYGVVSYSVAQRTREMGIRLALGATGGSVRGLVIRNALVPVGLGLLAGVAGAWGAGHLMAGLLYEVSPNDPLTLTGVSALILLTGWTATWIPTIKGTRIDPMITMRTE